MDGRVFELNLIGSEISDNDSECGFLIGNGDGDPGDSTIVSEKFDKFREDAVDILRLTVVDFNEGLIPGDLSENSV